MCGDETSNHGQIRANRSKAGLKERWWNRDQGRRPPPSLRGDCPRRRAELDDHLGYVKGDPGGNGSGNSRNGSYDKTVTTAAGPVRIGVPRDRNGSFEPRIVPKGQRRLGQVDDMILSLYARGMTTRDIQAHLAEVYGAEVSPALISNVTGVVAEEITAWQTRPLDAVYPIVYIDALVVKVRDGGTAGNKAAHLAIGVDIDGDQHPLGWPPGTGPGSSSSRPWSSTPRSGK